MVTEVPKFAPIIIGIAPCIVRAPPDTSPTMIDVVVDELWRSDVAKIPERSDIMGLSVKLKRVLAKPPPINFIPEVSILIPTRKIKRSKMTDNTLKIKSMAWFVPCSVWFDSIGLDVLKLILLKK